MCLSLLGTWEGAQGEAWNAETSTIIQVSLKPFFFLISSLIDDRAIGFAFDVFLPLGVDLHPELDSLPRAVLQRAGL